MTRNSHTANGGTGSESTTSRRRFLRGVAATAAVGATGVGFTGVAAAADAPSDYPRVTTREHFNDDAELINGEGETSYQQAGDFPESSDELTLMVHGWRNDDQDALNTAQETENALPDNDYDGDVAAYSWDSDKGDSLDLGWADAKDIAERNGPKLANFITEWNANVGTDVRLIAHSLGARVTVFAMKSLEERFDTSDAVVSATLLGGAVAEDAVSLDAGWFDAEYGSYIENSAEQFDNFHADDDPILEYIYETREWEDAVGEKGCEGPEPDNYTDFDVTDEIDDHGQYYQDGDGVIDQVVAQWS